MNACGNCDWHGPTGDCREIRDYAERIEAGEEAPAGECPECGALAYCMGAEEWADWANEVLDGEGLGECNGQPQFWFGTEPAYGPEVVWLNNSAETLPVDDWAELDESAIVALARSMAFLQSDD